MFLLPKKLFLVGNSTRALRLWNKNWSYSILRASWYLFYDIFREIYEIFPWNCHKHNLEWRDRLGRSKLCGTLHAMYSCRKSSHSTKNIYSFVGKSRSAIMGKSDHISYSKYSIILKMKEKYHYLLPGGCNFFRSDWKTALCKDML